MKEGGKVRRLEGRKVKQRAERMGRGEKAQSSKLKG
jgi:hypothetical protein